MDVSEYLQNNGWTIVRGVLRPEAPAAYEAPNKLPLSILSKRVLSNYNKGIYRHQYQALNALLEGHNVCLTTSTASGKSLVFYIAGIELLSRDPTSTVLAIYPLKALTDEQETKWKQAMDQTETKIVVGRIDGSVTGRDMRKKILRESSVVIMTPDVVHAWLLSNLGEQSVINFLSKLQMIVIDEAHTYSGVFGSNSAYLFRRLSHLATKLGASPRFIAASATMNNPAKHLQNLTGQEFHVIAQNLDSSGRKASRLLMVEPPDSDVFTSLTNLMQFITRETDHQFITFVDSRKQTEQMASMMRRNLEPDSDVEEIQYDMLERLQVHPFRAGYESSDRKRIQERLHEGSVRGVISTSALEMGIDLPWLTMGILYGIPYSATSYFQRVGRVGRHAEGTIIVVNNGSILSNRIFRQPESLDTMPLAESALYLENPRIQYIHAMCFARPGGEDDTVTGTGIVESEIAPFAKFPEAFLELSNRERVGEVGKAFQSMKAEAGNDPNHAFPLRDCEVQYQVEMKSSREPKALGSLSFSQVMREAYPGAVYYYHTRPYRVVKIQMREHTILVRSEKRYTTNPILIPTLVYPNLSEGNVYSAMRYGDFWVVESNLQITEIITGIKERRGPNELSYHYPLDPSQLGLYFDKPKFERNYFSSGVIITHPAFAGKEISREMLASLIFEAFLMEVPFERQDLHAAHDQFRVSRGAIPKGQRFLCVYDQTYGSLRLTGRLMEPQILRGVLDKAVEIAANDSAFALTPVTMSVLQLLRESVQRDPVQETLAEESPISLENVAVVILPGSIGLYPDYRNEEFRVDDVVYTPKGLIYKGKRLSQQGARFEGVTVTAPVDKIVTIPGRSELGDYDYESGEILPLSGSGSMSPDNDSDLIRITERVNNNGTRKSDNY